VLVCHCQQKEQAHLSCVGESLSTERTGTSQLCWCVTVNRKNRHSSAVLVCHCQQKEQAQLGCVGVPLSTERAGTSQLCWCVTVNRKSRHSSAIPQTGRIVVTFSVASEQNKMFLSGPFISFQSPFEDSNQATSQLRISSNHTEDTRPIRTMCGQVRSIRFYCGNLVHHVSDVFSGQNVKVLVSGPAVRMLTASLYWVNNEAALHEDVW
jgi:hypothetical protein